MDLALQMLHPSRVREANRRMAMHLYGKAEIQEDIPEIPVEALWAWNAYSTVVSDNARLDRVLIAQAFRDDKIRGSRVCGDALKLELRRYLFAISESHAKYREMEDVGALP